MRELKKSDTLELIMAKYEPECNLNFEQETGEDCVNNTIVPIARKCGMHLKRLPAK